MCHHISDRYCWSNDLFLLATWSVWIIFVVVVVVDVGISGLFERRL